ncbi:MAG: DMT family transporter [Polyangiaceae bacterium]
MARVYLALIAVQLLFGLWPVAGAAVLREMSPPALIGFRLFLGAPLLALLAGLPWRKRPSLRELGELAFLAALGISINQLLFAEGLSRAGPINASLSILLIPPVSLLVGRALGRERPTRKRLLGVAIAVLGALVFLRVERFDFGDRRAVGNLMLVCNASVYATYLVLAGPILTRLGTLRAMAWVFVLGAIEAAPFTLRPVMQVPWLTLPTWATGSLVFVLFGATLGTYLLNAYALRRVEASVVAVFVYLQPLVATLASWWLLNEIPTPRMLVAGALIVVGVFISADMASSIRRLLTRHST